jgi:hypothetical protein
VAVGDLLLPPWVLGCKASVTVTGCAWSNNDNNNNNNEDNNNNKMMMIMIQEA